MSHRKPVFLTVQFIRSHVGWETGQKAILVAWYAHNLIERGIAEPYLELNNVTVMNVTVTKIG